MCNTAAHLVGRVLPSVPVRQWVLSLPFELRRTAAFRADVATALGRIFIDEVAAHQKHRAGISGAEHGAVNFLQRFGGSLNLNLHFHAMVLDGVFTRDEDGTACFDDTGAPTQEALQRIVRRVRDRSVRWLHKNGLMDARPIQEHSNEPPEGGAIDACANVALGGGTLVRLDADGASRTEDSDHRRFEPRRRGPLTAEIDGFNLQAAVRIEATGDESRERLARYCARPAFALERLSVLPDGRIAYEVKYPSRRATHRVMTVVEFLARLAALVPPPRYPLVRYHGVLAPHSQWRSAVVPRPPDSNARAARAACAAPSAAQPRPSGCNRKPAGVGADGGGVDTRGSVPRLSLRGDGSTPRCHEADPKKWAALPETAARADAQRRPEPLPATAPAPEPAPRQPLLRPPEAGPSITPGDVEVTPQGISVRRVDHLLGGLLLATSPRVDWARLLRRTFDVDVLACTRCQGRLRLLSIITEPATVRRILEHLGIPARAPPILPRARDPAASVAAG